MRIREDSPFHGITEAQKEFLLELADDGTCHDDIAEEWVAMSGKEVATVQVKRFLRRLRYERTIREIDEPMEDLGRFAEGATDGKARDGLIEASRRALFEEALAEGNKELLLELYKAVNEERARERELEVEKRKAAVAEENAKIGWRKLEWERTKSAVRLLPKVQELLMEGNGTTEEKLAKILEVLTVGGAKLLESARDKSD